MSRYDEFFNEMMKDPEVKREFDALEPEFQLIREMIKARRIAGNGISDGVIRISDSPAYFPQR